MAFAAKRTGWHAQMQCHLLHAVLVTAQGRQRHIQELRVMHLVVLKTVQLELLMG